MTAPTPAELIAKFVALIANLRASKENLERVEKKHPLPDIDMGLQRQYATCSWAPYTEPGHYYESSYKVGTKEREYAENFMTQRKARESVNRITYWIREFYRLQKMMLNGATESQFRMYSARESINNLAQLLQVSPEDSFQLVMAIANTSFDWKQNGINTDEYDEEERRNLEFFERYNASSLTAPKMLPMVPL